MGSLGGLEWVVIILIVFLLFGAKKIPELARGIGQGLTEFRKASDNVKKDIENGGNEPAAGQDSGKSSENQSENKAKS